MEYELHKLQKRLTEMLFIIDDFCKKNNINYMLEGGTALGAFRHKGFIPWDDDIDISMDYAEYKRFCQLFVKNPPSGLALQIHETDKNYINSYAKIRDLNSYMKEDRVNIDYKFNGLFIDVFPYENVNPTLLQISHLLFHRIQFAMAEAKSDKYGILSFAINLFFYISLFSDTIFRFVSKILPTTYSYTYGCNIKAKMGQWKEDTFFPIKEMMFEGKMLPVPGKIEEFLANKYGDYMRIPPEDQRDHFHCVGFELYDD